MVSRPVEGSDPEDNASLAPLTGEMNQRGLFSKKGSLSLFCSVGETAPNVSCVFRLWQMSAASVLFLALRCRQVTIAVWDAGFQAAVESAMFAVWLQEVISAGRRWALFRLPNGVETSRFNANTAKVKR